MKKATENIDRRLLNKSATATAATVIAGLFASKDKAKADDAKPADDAKAKAMRNLLEGDPIKRLVAVIVDDATGAEITTVSAQENQASITHTVASMPLHRGRTYSLNISHEMGTAQKLAGISYRISEGTFGEPEKVETIGYPHTAASFTIPEDAPLGKQNIKYKYDNCIASIDFEVVDKITNHPDQAVVTEFKRTDTEDYLTTFATKDFMGGKQTTIKSRFGLISSVCFSISRKDQKDYSKESYLKFTAGNMKNRFASHGMMAIEQIKKVEETGDTCFEIAYTRPGTNVDPSASNDSPFANITLTNEEGQPLLSQHLSVVAA